jgi:hypothetical protein
MLFSAVGFGCSSSLVFVHALEPPKWPVAPNRSIGIVAVLENKRGTNAHLTRDLTLLLTDKLKKSAYYTKIATQDLTTGEFKIGKTGERLPLEATNRACSKKLGVELLLFVEILDSKMWTQLGARVGYGVGFGRSYGHTAIGTSLSTGTNYWNAQARMLTAITLVRAKNNEILSSSVEGHSFHRTYADTLPSESDVFEKLVDWVSSRVLTYIDVYYHPAPRHLRSDGTQPVADGVRYALRGGRHNWETARHFWSKAHADNPGSLAATYNLGVAAEKREDFAEAVSYYAGANELAGKEDAFTREIEEASHSAEVLSKFGSLREASGEIKQPPKPEKAAQPSLEAKPRN